MTDTARSNRDHKEAEVLEAHDEKGYQASTASLGGTDGAERSEADPDEVNRPRNAAGEVEAFSRPEEVPGTGGTG